MSAVTFVIGWILLLCPVLGADLTAKRLYAPEPGDGYQQIIQRRDYNTVAFIEAWYKKLSSLARPRKLPATARAELFDGVLRITPRAEPRPALALRVEGDNAVRLGDRRFDEAATVILCATMLRIFSDLEKAEKCRQMSFAQFPTRTYRRRTLVAFDFGPRVLEIDCQSNGPSDDERLYILDLIERAESYFWAKGP